VPDQWWGDFLAMMGAARIGERELSALGAEVGWATLDEFASSWFDYSERRCAEAIRALPPGRVEASSVHDAFPGTPAKGITVKSVVTTLPEEAIVEVDLTDNPDNLPCGLNLSEACSRTAALIGVFNSIDHTVPKNAGSFRRIRIKLREGCIVGIPLHPTSCSVSTTNIADRVANATQRAMAELSDHCGMAEVGAVIPPSAGVISGEDPRTGEVYVNQVFLGFTGGAGGPFADAWLTQAHVGNGGLSYQDSIELDELYQPIEVQARRILPDTEGAGRFRGAPSILVEFGPTLGSFEIGYVSDGAVNAPLGARGGQTGGASQQFLRDRQGVLQPLAACAQVVVQAGETIVSVSTGGGGYGDPFTRDPALVRKDVAEGWVTAERARTVYGFSEDVGTA
jgi:N-methylhydantoinase B